MTEQYDAFLSHNSADKPAVEELAKRLRAAGIEPWLDKWHLIPGVPWQEEIEQALDRCSTCVVFVGAAGLGPWHHEEMRAAIDRRHALVPIQRSGDDGRGDGENYQIGFVDVCDRPYPEITRACHEVGERMYEVRMGER